MKRLQARMRITKKGIALEVPRLLKINEAAKILDVHTNTLRKWDANGFLKAIHYGLRGERRYKVKDILKFREKMLKERGQRA